MKATHLVPTGLLALISSACAVVREEAASAALFEPTVESLANHDVPAWFDDAKLGIFVNWGPYSVPGYAPTTGSLSEVVAMYGIEGLFARNPYAEWYWNSMQLEGPTRDFHANNYGPSITYADFAVDFGEAINSWDPEPWAELFELAGARYVVLDAKHHDGFLLWPSVTPNPDKPNWQTERDVVGEVANAVRERNMRFGIYYSGGIDWAFSPFLIHDLEDLDAAIPQSDMYGTYADAHWRELIERYEPSVLWNDIGYPRTGNPLMIFADYYNQHPDGVINNRWSQDSDTVSHIAIDQALYDFTTPEYTVENEIRPYKWETTRGIGFSFGYNREENDESFLSVNELVDSLVDIVSKNGNLLLGVGPKADGTIPDDQKQRLLGLGNWLNVNREAIFGTRPWQVAEGTTIDGLPLRFTAKEDTLYAVMLESPSASEVTLAGLVAVHTTEIILLGSEELLIWENTSQGIRILLPRLANSPAYTLQLTPQPQRSEF